ncbi:TPA: DNA circularization protein [Vibrio harveyi]
MAFEDRLTASFRGVTFLLDEASGDSGRRAIPHAYPKKELGYTEDNGKVLTSEQISGRTVGDNYFDELADILDALNNPGPGELIHPWFGVRKVQIGKVSHRLVNKVDGLATFNFEVFEVGENLFPNARKDTAKQVQEEAAKSQDAANQDFEESYDKSFLDGVIEMVEAFIDDVMEFVQGIAAIVENVKEWVDKAQRLKDTIDKLIAIPGELAASVMGLLEDVKGIVTDPMRALDVYNNVINRWNGARAELAITGGLTKNISSENGFASSVPAVSNPSGEAAMMSNADAFKRLALNSAVVSKASAMGDADISFNLTDSVDTVSSLSGAERKRLLTGPQLKQIGYEIARQLAELASEAVERGDSAVWRQFRVLRQAVLSDTRDRAELLPQVTIYTPIDTVPVSLVAWQRNGDTETRESIVKRNGLANPAFILPSDSIEVING